MTGTVLFQVAFWGGAALWVMAVGFVASGTAQSWVVEKLTRNRKDKADP